MPITTSSSRDETVDVVIATYGSKEIWSILAQRAVCSAEAQSVKPDAVWYYHDEEGVDLSRARNEAARWSDSDWLIFLDADDELDGRYIESMLQGEGDLRWPSLLRIHDGVEDPCPTLLEPFENIVVANHMCIGTMLRRELFAQVGGFRRGLPILEDWDLWIRCLIAGAQDRPCSRAVYRQHMRADSRNQKRALQVDIANEIRRRYGGLL